MSHTSRSSTGFVSGLCEIVLSVRDVEACTRFYREVVGLVAEGEPEHDWAWFRCERDGHAQRLAITNRVLAFEEHSPHPPGKRFGHVHFALLVMRGDLASAVDRARAAGVKVFGPIRHEWMKAESYYLYDPAGNLVEFFSPDDAG